MLLTVVFCSRTPSEEKNFTEVKNVQKTPVTKQNKKNAPPVPTLFDDLFRSKQPGDTVRLPEGTFTGTVIVPGGVSIVGADARKTVINGTVSLKSTLKHPVILSSVSVISDSEKGWYLISCKGADFTIKHCLLYSTTKSNVISAGDAYSLLITNTIIIGNCGLRTYGGEYNHDEGSYCDIINCTFISRDYAILLEKSEAKIINCLFYGSLKPTIIRSRSHYTLGYSNFNMKDSVAGYGCEKFELLCDRFARCDGDSADGNYIRDNVMYASEGLTFKQHDWTRSTDVEQYKKEQPPFAVGGGSPEKKYRNPEGSRNTLGAFGGPSGEW